ncbi:MAG TPA: response regulator transcription factor [Chitinophagaceae bacterium]|jgi:DNA-binding NarL/FixJ family response regulator|nr:response regulator transcription factor [Chitinophagaceae bacterium]
MLRILVADDYEIVRRGLKQILVEAFPEIHVEEAIDTPDLIDKALNDRWDFIITDIIMPGGNGLEAMKKIKAQMASLPVLIISTYPEDQYTSHAINAGADGYLSKNTIPEHLITAIQQILSGKKYISKDLLSGPDINQLS